jgi:hypothetical protein
MVDRRGARSMNDPIENHAPSEEKCSDEEFCRSENTLASKSLDGTGKIPEEKKKSLAFMLEEKCKDIELFEDHDGIEYATVKKNGHYETHRIESHVFKKILSKRYSDAFQKGISAAIIDEVCLTLKAKAGNGKKYVVSHRIAGDGVTYIEIDLGNEKYNSVRVDKIKGISIGPHVSRFVRTPAMRHLPNPERGGSLNTIRKKFITNISDEGFVLLCGFMLLALHPKQCPISFPIGVLRGEHGSAKSTVARIVRSLTDPSKTDVRTMVNDPKSLPALLKGAHLLNFDNVGSIPEWLSNDLCVISTGGAIGARKLYSDDDDFVCDAHAPILLNGITDSCTKPDILDRIFAIYLDTIPEGKHRARKTIEREWELERPAVFGAILDALLRSMQRRDEIEAQDRPLPRMADAAVIILAAEDLFGPPVGTFERALAGQREEATAFTLDTPLGIALGAFKETYLHSEIEWHGTKTELLEILAKIVDPQGRGLAKPWPGNARAFSNKLKEMVPDLRRGYGLHFRSYLANRKKMVLVSRIALSKTDQGQPSFGFGDASGGGGDASGFACDAEKACNHAGETLATLETQNLFPSVPADFTLSSRSPNGSQNDYGHRDGPLDDDDSEEFPI